MNPLKIVCLIIVSITLFLPSKAFCQIDSTYIQPFDEAFSIRVHGSDKFMAFSKENEKDDSREFTYKTNSPVSLGIGLSWKNYSFSFGHGFDFFRNKKRGKTESLEFQHHSYGRKIVYDIFLQHHNGFYNEDRNEDGTYTTYPDIKLRMYGGSLQYVFNNKKFSYGAAFNQNQRQLKSAGSFHVGGSIYYSKVRTDSTYLFDGMATVHQNLQFGVTVGYGHTWVMSSHWFMTGSFTLGASIGNNYPSRFFKERVQVYPTINGRFALGYNADSWSFGTSFHFNRVYLFFDREESLGMDNGNIQLTFIKRFDWGKADETLKKTKKKLRLR